MGDFRNANQSRLMDRAQHAAARAFLRSPAIARRVVNAGEVADYTGWLTERFGPVRLLRHREDLWRSLPPVRSGVEFGVAWGYATDWWLRNTAVEEWHGFDRFTGLPRAWHGEDEGAYSADGKPPAIDDPRVTWHVGDVEDTLPGFTLPAGPRLLFFDLDIHEPTAVAWRHLSPQLAPGDLVYFDEAMARDERRVLDELVLPEGRWELVGATPLALALRAT